MTLPLGQEKIRKNFKIKKQHNNLPAKVGFLKIESTIDVRKTEVEKKSAQREKRLRIKIT